MVLKSVSFAVAVALVLAWGGIGSGHRGCLEVSHGAALRALTTTSPTNISVSISPRRCCRQSGSGPRRSSPRLRWRRREATRRRRAANPSTCRRKLPPNACTWPSRRLFMPGAPSHAAQRAPSLHIVAAIRWTRRRWTPASRPGRAATAAFATGSASRVCRVIPTSQNRRRGVKKPSG